MIKSVKVTNYLGESIKLELGFPEKSGFLIQSITGLGPPKADIHKTEVATNDGSLYNSARVNSRNIVLSLKLMYQPSVEAMRQMSYKYFPLKKRVVLLIETDNRNCYTSGYVESNEPDIFSSNETTQISIICPDPYFYSTDGTTTLFSGIVSNFKFPFSNNSLTNKLIKFGEILSLTMKTILYTGDAETGAIISIHALGPATNVIIYNVDTHESMKIDTVKLAALTGHGIITSDDIIISTIKGDKYITLLREGVTTNILNCLDKNADWIQLSKGDNIVAYTAESGASNLQFKVENPTLYEGV